MVLAQDAQPVRANRIGKHDAAWCGHFNGLKHFRHDWLDVLIAHVLVDLSDRVAQLPSSFLSPATMALRSRSLSTFSNLENRSMCQKTALQRKRCSMALGSRGDGVFVAIIVSSSGRAGIAGSPIFGNASAALMRSQRSLSLRHACNAGTAGAASFPSRASAAHATRRASGLAHSSIFAKGAADAGLVFRRARATMSRGRIRFAGVSCKLRARQFPPPMICLHRGALQRGLLVSALEIVEVVSPHQDTLRQRLPHRCRARPEAGTDPNATEDAWIFPASFTAMAASRRTVSKLSSFAPPRPMNKTRFAAPLVASVSLASRALPRNESIRFGARTTTRPVFGKGSRQPLEIKFHRR